MEAAIVSLMNEKTIYQAALNSKNASLFDYFLAKWFGVRAVIEFEERRKKSRRKNAATVLIQHSFIVADYADKTYLIDKRINDRRRQLH
jgi:hypothetical protein